MIGFSLRTSFASFSLVLGAHAPTSGLFIDFSGRLTWIDLRGFDTSTSFAGFSLFLGARAPTSSLLSDFSGQLTWIDLRWFDMSTSGFGNGHQLLGLIPVSRCSSTNNKRFLWFLGSVWGRLVIILRYRTTIN